MSIIGLSGRKQSGKTTSAAWILEHYDAMQYDFADPLKKIILRCFNVGFHNLYGTDTQKNEILPCGLTGRQLMQQVGTDWFRAIEPGCWVQAWQRHVIKAMSSPHLNISKLVVVADVRFPNEVKAIQDLGGKVIRLRRRLRGNFDFHPSETALDDCLGIFNCTIDNQNVTIEERNEALERYFDSYLKDIMVINKK